MNCRPVILILFLLLAALLALPVVNVRAEELPWSINLYGGQLTSNHWEELLNPTSEIDFNDSYLAALTLSRTFARWRDRASFEAEGQVVKHFNFQEHWEFNILATARWEAFPWDRYLDTEFAFGIGPSYATEVPLTEIANEGDSEKLLVYWMMELAFSLPDKPRWALIGRIHHRSEAYGLFAEEGGANALALGLKYRF